jgi:hypothetical protein
MFSLEKVWFMVLVFNATFNNISVISWWSVLLVEDIAVPGENLVEKKTSHTNKSPWPKTSIAYPFLCIFIF